MLRPRARSAAALASLCVSCAAILGIDDVTYQTVEVPDSGVPDDVGPAHDVGAPPQDVADEPTCPACQAPRVCNRGKCVAPSCRDLEPKCAGSEDCCDYVQVPVSSFRRGRSLDGGDATDAGLPDELPEHVVQMSQAFYLDKFEVTVGRFRRFVASFGGPPEAGAGAHPAVPGSGWNGAWASVAFPDGGFDIERTAKCTGTTWTDAVAGNEYLPINCVSWLEAFAFCVWDGGRLPLESEWEYAAAGGKNNFLYPWGDAAPDGTLASYGCADAALACLRPVGSSPGGNTSGGIFDMSGSLWEVTRDVYESAWYGTIADSGCTYCAELKDDPDGSPLGRAMRGGGFSGAASDLRAARRASIQRDYPVQEIGFRCAR